MSHPVRPTLANLLSHRNWLGICSALQSFIHTLYDYENKSVSAVCTINVNVQTTPHSNQMLMSHEGRVSFPTF